MRCLRCACGLLLAAVQAPFLFGGALPANIHFFPHIGDGGGLRTVFLIMNPSRVGCEVRLELIRHDGAEWDLPVGPGRGPVLRMMIQSGGSRRLETPGIDPIPVVGWARLSADCPVSAQAVFEIRTGEGLVAQAAVDSAAPQRNLDLFFDSGNGTDTGVAVANLSRLAPVQVTILHLRWDGTAGGAATLTLGPGQQSAKFASELLGPGVRRGILRLQATGPVAVTCLQQTGLVLSTLPVVTRSMSMP